MKKLSVIILASILAFTTFSCGDDDDKNEKQASFTGGIWKIAFLSIDNEEQTLDQCELSETFEFMEDGTFVQKIFSLNDAKDGCDLDTERKGQWVSGGGSFYDISFENDLYPNIRMSLGLSALVYDIDFKNDEQLIDGYSYRFEKK